MKRAIVDRGYGLADEIIDDLPARFGTPRDRVEFIQSRLQFKWSKQARRAAKGLAVQLDHNDDDNDDDAEDGGDLRASPTSVCWSRGVTDRPLFVLCKGNLQGATKSAKKSGSVVPPISKLNFLRMFKSVRAAILLSDVLQSEEMKTLSYAECKRLAIDYERGLDAFHKAPPWSDWLRTDANKYYVFK